LFNEGINNRQSGPATKIIHSTNCQCSNSSFNQKCKLFKIWFSTLTFLWGQKVQIASHNIYWWSTF
jgi:hypothetical protein